jgi:hypothetical protein
LGNGATDRSSQTAHELCAAHNEREHPRFADERPRGSGPLGPWVFAVAKQLGLADDPHKQGRCMMLLERDGGGPFDRLRRDKAFIWQSYPSR